MKKVIYLLFALLISASVTIQSQVKPTLAEVRSTLPPRANCVPDLMTRSGSQIRSGGVFGKLPSGEAIDYGTLKQEPGKPVEVFTPGGWVTYNPSEHITLATLNARIGPGASAGNNSTHSKGRGCFEKVYGRAPTLVENIDMQFCSSELNKICGLADSGVVVGPGNTTNCPKCPTCTPCVACPSCPPTPVCPPVAPAVVYTSSGSLPSQDVRVRFYDRFLSLEHTGRRHSSGVWFTLSGGRFTDAEVYAWVSIPPAPVIK